MVASSKVHQERQAKTDVSQSSRHKLNIPSHSDFDVSTAPKSLSDKELLEYINISYTYTYLLTYSRV